MQKVLSKNHLSQIIEEARDMVNIIVEVKEIKV